MAKLYDKHAMLIGSNKRFPRRGGPRPIPVDEVELDKNQSTAESVLEVLTNVCINAGLTDRKRGSYLSAFVRLLSAAQTGSHPSLDLGLRIKEILLCLRIPLASESCEVRVGTLRAVRYLIKTNQDASAVISVNMHLLIVRILDLDPDLKAERIQAARLTRRLLVLGPLCFPTTLVKAVSAIVQKNAKERQHDSLWKWSLSLLCELSVLNASLFVRCGCVKVVSKVVLDCVNIPRIVEAALGCLMRIYNVPSLRRISGLDLSNVVAPFTELHFHTGSLPQEETRLDCATTAILCLLRSWPGLIHISDPHLSSRPLQSLVDILHLQSHGSRKISYETRKAVLEILFKSLDLQVPEWTDEFEVAMRTADPSSPRESWRLNEGFVAKEGRDILPHLSKSRPNLTENHKCFLLSCYLKCRLPDALIQVIVTSDSVLSVRASVLLGQILHLASLLLPPEVGALSHCLPNLALRVATQHFAYSKSESTRAVFAVTALQKLHNLKKRGPRPYSLLLEQTMNSSGRQQGEGFVGDKLSLPGPSPSSAPPSQSITTSTDLATLNNIKQSQVISNRDPQSWKWDLVMFILKWPSESLKRLEDSNSKLFVRKLADFFKPTCNMFSLKELESEKTRFYGRLGCCLLDFLLLASSPVNNFDRRSLDSDRKSIESEKRGGLESEADSIMDDLLRDVFGCIKQVVDSNTPHDCIFSPSRLTNTACQLYFLFLGRLSSTEQGRAVLDRHQALHYFMNLLNSRSDVYLKLVVSCVDYRAVDWGGRLILSKALTQVNQNGKLYATRWLGVLARAGAPSFAQYGVEFLVEQLKDSSLQVAATALAILDEICEDKLYLESLVAAKSILLSSSCKQALDKLGSRGRLLLTRFLSSATGFSVMMGNGWLKSELAQWAEAYNTKYVLIVEGILNDGFTVHQRELDGHGGYGRRSGEEFSCRDVFLPPHLYGQLAQTKAGLEVLLNDEAFSSLANLLRDVEEKQWGVDMTRGTRPDDAESCLEESWLQVKAAIWCVAHAASSPEGSLEMERRGLLNILVNLAESCSVLSIKGAAYYALGLLGTNRYGANALGSRGWATIRHSRNDIWPINTEWIGSVDSVLPLATATPRIDRDVESPLSLPEACSGGGGGQFVAYQTAHDDDEDDDEDDLSYAGHFGGRRRDDDDDDAGLPSAKSSISQNTLELGLSPFEPGVPMSFKLTNKLTTWLSGGGSGSTNGRSGGSGSFVASDSKPERRNSESGRHLGSSFANKIRKSFRSRSHTISEGSVSSREGTPSASQTPRMGGGGGGGGMMQPHPRKLVYNDPERVATRLDSQTALTPLPTSPSDTLPGEIFPLENIVEEPTVGAPEDKRLGTDEKDGSSSAKTGQSTAAVMTPGTGNVSRQSIELMRGAEFHLSQSERRADKVHDKSSESLGVTAKSFADVPLKPLKRREPSHYSESDKMVVMHRSPHNQSFGSAKSVQQLEDPDLSFLNPDPGAGLRSDPNRSTEIQFSAVKYDSGLVSIRHGTSISSVSSVGSFSMQESILPGSLVRNRKKKRPILSDSEDPEAFSSHNTSMSLSVKDAFSNKTKPIDYRLSRGYPAIGGGPRQPGDSALFEMTAGRVIPTACVTSVPSAQKHPSASFLAAAAASSGRSDSSKEPRYWGIVYPIYHNVLYPPPEDRSSDAAAPTRCNDLSGIVSAWLQSTTRHSMTTCLACCRLRPSTRPRAASLTAARDDLRTSVLLSSSLPSSYQSPEAKRKSLHLANNPNSVSVTLIDSDSPDPSINYEDSKNEALEYIYAMTAVKEKQSELALLKLKNKVPRLFQDMCFYSDVCQLMGEYSFRSSARKSLHDLFRDLNISQMELEAKLILNQSEPQLDTPVIANDNQSTS